MITLSALAWGCGPVDRFIKPAGHSKQSNHTSIFWVTGSDNSE